MRPGTAASCQEGQAGASRGVALAITSMTRPCATQILCDGLRTAGSAAGCALLLLWLEHQLLRTPGLGLSL